VVGHELAEPLQLLAEDGDVLVGEMAYLLELFGMLSLSTTHRRDPRGGVGTATSDRESEQQPLHDPFYHRRRAT
jgi:hypothetical protein